jgi:hypothetical protein
VPSNVRNLAVAIGDATVTLTYEIPSGADRVVIMRSSAGVAAQTVYSGNSNTYTDRGLTNGTEYRYVVASVDGAGNRSGGVAIVVTPSRNLLKAPKDGARLKRPPKLAWARQAETAYYNVQLFRGDVKILSRWPRKATLPLRKSWKFNGRRYTLTRGLYRWYVWPGFGPRVQATYGQMLGARSFQIVR